VADARFDKSAPWLAFRDLRVVQVVVQRVPEVEMQSGRRS
jgi:hypothetical protein